MFGTCIAVFDGYARAMSETIKLLFNEKEQEEEKNSKRLYRIILLIVSIGAFALIARFHQDKEGFGKLVNLATSVSFIIAPIIAIFNLKLVSAKHVDEEFVPPVWLRILAYLGIVFLLLFTVLFIFQDSFLT